VFEAGIQMIFQL